MCLEGGGGTWLQLGLAALNARCGNLETLRFKTQDSGFHLEATGPAYPHVTSANTTLHRATRTSHIVMQPVAECFPYSGHSALGQERGLKSRGECEDLISLWPQIEGAGFKGRVSGLYSAGFPGPDTH